MDVSGPPRTGFYVHPVHFNTLMSFTELGFAIRSIDINKIHDIGNKIRSILSIRFQFMSPEEEQTFLNNAKSLFIEKMKKEFPYGNIWACGRGPITFFSNEFLRTNYIPPTYNIALSLNLEESRKQHKLIFVVTEKVDDKDLSLCTFDLKNILI